jgi:hypothetical protein
MRFSRILRSGALAAVASVIALSLAGSAEAGKRPPSGGTGCTNTNVYWSHNLTHPAWDKVEPNGPHTIFFLSGRSYLQMLTDSTGQSPYNELALDYIAAELNAYSGASMPAEVFSAFLAAHDLFTFYAPTYDFVTDPDGVTAEFGSLRTTLKLYNTGKLGPGACGGKRR